MMTFSGQIVPLVAIMARLSKRKTARVSVHRQKPSGTAAKRFRFDSDTVLVHREGKAVILEPAHEWPDGYVESFAGVSDDFAASSGNR